MLKEQGIHLEQRLCTACGAQSAERATFDDGRLQLLCDACRKAAEIKFQSESQFSVGQLPFLLISGAVCAIVGAIIWGGAWYGFHWIINQQASDTVYLPVAALALVSCGAGCLVPQPLVYYVSKVRNRGAGFGSWFAVICTALALVLSEFLFAAALFTETFKLIVPPSLLPGLWPVVVSNLSIPKLIGAGAGLFVAYKQAQPRKPVA